MSLEDDVDAILEECFAGRNTLFSERPLLAHYTSLEVAEKLLKGDAEGVGELWFSNPLYMNDYQELRHGVNLGADLLHESQSIRSACGSDTAFQTLLSEFEKLLREFDDKEVIDTFVACFAEHEPDDNDGLLSMWRGYGARGCGVSLVFNTEKLVEVPTSPLIVGRVEYESDAVREERLTQLLDRIARLLGSQPQPETFLRGTAELWLHCIKTFALFTKHLGFKEEREWRVVYLKDRDSAGLLKSAMSYLVTDRGVEPKLKVRLTTTPGVLSESVSVLQSVDRIILGPTISSPLAVRSFKKMLELTGKSALSDRVVASTIPFRAR